jgi:hypothetical protein
MLRKLGIALGVLVALLCLAGFALVWGIADGGLGSHEGPGEVTQIPVPDAVVAERARRQSPAAVPTSDKQILFGDLHVHTTFSSDAFMFSLPMLQGEGAHPPADACDFARFCSDLDFWSINEHAELTTPRQWTEIKESIRQCNAVAGDPDNPDLVAFLGWEWTQFASDPERHYGHKNIILRETADDRVPTRPIGSGRDPLTSFMLDRPFLLRIGPPLLEFPEMGRYINLNRYVSETAAIEVCKSGVDVRQLPPDCHEYAITPETLYEKLAQWGHESLVIPHGTSWGIHAPPGSGLKKQLSPGQHDPSRQRLFEVYSGHGNSEVLRPWRHVKAAPNGKKSCPEPRDGFTPCCWRAGELIRERCGDDVPAQMCEARVALAKQQFVEAAGDMLRFRVVAGAEAEDWGACGQLLDEFLPAFHYRPGMSAQAALALGGFEGTDPGAPRRFRFGLIGASDNHYARAGTGYKEFSRPGMTDARAISNEFAAKLPAPEPAERLPESRIFEDMRAQNMVPRLLRPERGGSFFYTGGLAGVHARGRSREAIWDALHAREVYATSGDRMLLWFDLLNAPGGPAPMGSEATLAEMPRFRVRALGAFWQEPGCPEHSLSSLSPERLQHLCKGECYNPSNRRKRITRIEVVRIRPQVRPDEPIESLVQDPWLTVSCPGDPAGCVVEFEDPQFADSSRSTTYYVRAIQEPSPAVNGAQLRCEFDEQGSCVKIRPCYASGPEQATDDCLAPVEERAWSSPIFLDPI